MILSFSNNVKNEIRSNIAGISRGSVCYELAEIFLEYGSILEPAKGYHLEFNFPSLYTAEEFLETLTEQEINAGLTERNGSYVIYIKNSEAIEDFLTMTGAPMSSVELMNVKIYKDVRNKANRIANCDAANIERTLKASDRQIADIEYIAETAGLESLPYNLRNIAKIRLSNPEISLQELGQLLQKPISKSGVRHRLNKISEIAGNMRM